MSGPTLPGAFSIVTVEIISPGEITFTADASFIEYIREASSQYGNKFVAFVTPACNQSGGSSPGEGSQS
jgi:hypothetical protein